MDVFEYFVTTLIILPVSVSPQNTIVLTIFLEAMTSRRTFATVCTAFTYAEVIKNFDRNRRKFRFTSLRYPPGIYSPSLGSCCRKILRSPAIRETPEAFKIPFFFFNLKNPRKEHISHKPWLRRASADSNIVLNTIRFRAITISYRIYYLSDESWNLHARGT